jgi:arginine N-succinyltransferase
MLVIRPIKDEDLDDFVGFAKGSGVGVTTLPDNPDLLEQRIHSSVRSFRKSQPKERGNYVFALEDSDAGCIAGVSAVIAYVGKDEVWYNYRISKVVHASKEIGVHTMNEMLYITNDMTGVSEMCTLYLDTPYRKGNNGALLSKCRMLFVADNMELFADKMIAEMRGFSDENGVSPFWESLGRKFFQMDFSDADYEIGLGNKSLIAELMPKYPIYLFFLSPEARAAIAKTHDNTRPALEMLKREGFHFNGYVDIFDAGPVMESFVEDIRAVRESRLLTVEISSVQPSVEHERSDYVASNRRFEGFRACLLRADQVQGKRALLSPEQAQSLAVEAGDSLRAVPLRYE